ncbi:hypothetical protein BK634_17210 [Pseudomonas chlororaphis]|nr:hypothetical protein BK634_17210 [Pseudomonas chlororaphis]WEK07069.1 MAG: hypothetical protein P0Y51_17105 [Pseudomonas sp.]
MHRLEHNVDNQWLPYSHPPIFQVAAIGQGQRIVAAVPGSDPEVVTRLVRCLSEPFILLYILHTPRGGEGEAGRYQSPELTRQEFEAFINEFTPLLSRDSRFDLWVYAPEENATVVWDRHDLLYAYGPLDAYTRELRALGFSHGQPEMPVPHAHNYHAKLDDLSRQLINRFEWRHSPLRPEDEQ